MEGTGYDDPDDLPLIRPSVPDAAIEGNKTISSLLLMRFS
ncbi:unnamed protein product [Strongylus vulgaris]|uniref:Uncharacterized protein n=1 Tax=Strongylus vulgaris TaxID=40348 RepID=A0A3P7IUA2_STRVU|nr:unnamed protein product [Strongylus vulgaris]